MKSFLRPIVPLAIRPSRTHYERNTVRVNYRHQYRDVPNRACYSDAANVAYWHITDVSSMDGDFRFLGGKADMTSAKSALPI